MTIMKQKLTSEEQQAIYDVGYADGTSDQFIPLILIGLGGCVVGIVIGMCL